MITVLWLWLHSATVLVLVHLATAILLAIGIKGLVIDELRDWWRAHKRAGKHK